MTVELKKKEYEHPEIEMVYLAHTDAIGTTLLSDETGDEPVFFGAGKSEWSDWV